MKHFDNYACYYINLDHRTDREENLLKHLNNFSEVTRRAVRFRGSYTEGFGAYGCALSHSKLLAHFLYNIETKFEFLIVLEDDFEFTCSHAEFEELLLTISQNSSQIDLVQLAYSSPISYPVQIGNFPFRRVLRSFGTLGFIVGRRFASRLLQTFTDSANVLSSYIHLDHFGRHTVRQLAAVDVIWHRDQLMHQFLATIEPYGREHPSKSDILS
jgi:hypothetical protein